MPRLATRQLLTFATLLLFAGPAGAQWIPQNPVTSFEKQADGVVFTITSLGRLGNAAVGE